MNLELGGTVKSLFAIVRLEFGRILGPSRLLVSLACIAVAVLLAYGDIALIGQYLGTLSNSSSFDVFYVALNDPVVAELIFPAGALVLCADSFSVENRWGMRSVIITRLDRRGIWMVGKLLSMLIACMLFAFSCLIALTVVDMLRFGTMPTSVVPDWLSYSGNPADFQWNRYPVRLSSIPVNWNYATLVILLAVVEGLICMSISTAVAAVSSTLRLNANPILFGCVALACLQALPTVCSNIGFLANPAAAQRDWGFLLDRFCLAYYCLGANAWQTDVGQAMFTTIDINGLQATESLATTVNSFAVLTLLLMVLAATSLAVICSRYGNGGLAANGKGGWQ